MTLFQILTRRVATGKTKVTRKLLDRVCRETGGKPCSKPTKPPRRKRGGFTCSFCAALVAVLMLPIWLVTAHAAVGAQPRGSSIATGGYSAAGLFNRANACAREGKSGLAILNYERALLLAPNEADIAANLHFVRAKAGLPDAPENWFTRSLRYARPNTLAWLGSLGLALAGMSLLLVRLYPQRRLALRSLTFAGVLLVATAIGSAITMWPRINEAVVISREAPARIAPVSAAEAAFKLHEGETVTMRAEHQDFALVQTSAGRSGWVARADLARVMPQFRDRS
jgi:tetratricopeptide (TPR) repeat protein